MVLEPFTLGFYSAGSPARGIIAAAALNKALQDRYGSSSPLAVAVVVDELGIEQDKAAGRALEALSRSGLDVPPSRVLPLASQPEPGVDCYVAFTEEEMSALAAAGAGRSLPPAYGLWGLAGLNRQDVADTLGDYAPMISAISDLVERAIPRMLLLARRKHLSAAASAAAEFMDDYRALEREVSRMEDFAASASAAEAAEAALFRLLDPEGPVREYAAVYGDICMCGGAMQLVSERLHSGVYELTLVCDRCGRRVVRRQ